MGHRNLIDPPMLIAEHSLPKNSQRILRGRYQLLALCGLIVLLLLPSDGVGITLCPLKNLSGLDCPACGLTRSVSSLMHLDFVRSFSYHPLGALALLGLALTVLPIQSPERLRSSSVARALYHFRWQITVALVVTVWVLRLFTGE